MKKAIVATLRAKAISSNFYTEQIIFCPYKFVLLLR